jgi:8-amino-7-oxononanoate synthase
MPEPPSGGATTGADSPTTARPATWLARWLDVNADLARLHASNPMLDAVVDEQDGRRIRIGGHWLVDFASCNYLGFDLDPEIIAAVPGYLARWGTHPSWSRMLASPALNRRIDAELAALLGAEDVLTLPTITHIHGSVLPALADQGTVYLDARAHKTIWDGCQLARGRGATVRRFAHDDPDELERLLRAGGAEPRVICTDGINSMTGNPPPLHAYTELARAYDALLYVDDGHGFGVVGERAPDEPCPYGRRGNGLVRHLGESYDHVVLVGGFSKAYSSLLAFVACSTRLKELLKIAAPPYLYSGPSPIASLATVLEGLRVNAERGDELRTRLWHHTRRVLDTLGELGAWTPNTSGFPIVEVPLADPDDLDRVGAFLFVRGVYATLAFYPGVPRTQVGFRLQLTAANTDDELDLLTDVLHDLASRFPLRSADEPRTVVLP